MRHSVVLISVLHSIISNFSRTIFHLGRLSLPKPYCTSSPYMFTVIANDVNYTSVTMHLAPPIIGLNFLISSSVKLVKNQTKVFVVITASCGFCDKLPADRIS